MQQRDADAPPERFAATARRGERLPSRSTGSSTGLGWRQVHAEVFADPAEVEAFATAPTPDLLLVYALTGTSHMQSRHGRSWYATGFAPGSLAATAPGRVSTLRWRAAGPEPVTSLHVHRHHELLAETAAALGVPGSPDALPDALSLADPLLGGVGPALLGALHRRDGGIYPDTIAAAAAAHLLTGLRGRERAPRPPGALSHRQLAAVVEHMHAHLAEDVRLDDLAAVVHLSKFHLVRAFRAATGTTPHRHLTTLRLTRAAELLRSTDLPVSAVAQRCGWTSASRFSAAFHRHHGSPPGAYRAAG